MAPSDGGTILSSSNCPTVIYLRLTDFYTTKEEEPRLGRKTALTATGGKTKARTTNAR